MRGSARTYKPLVERGEPGSRDRSLSGVRKRFSDKIATVGRHVFVAAVSGLRGRDEARPQAELPLGLRSQPSGAITVPAPAGEGAWEEVFRDFARVLQGDSVFVIGRQRMYPVRGTNLTGVDEAARNAAFAALARALRDELVLQGSGLAASGQVDDRLLRELSLQVAANVSVGPGVQVALARGLPPTLWQPAFTVCVGEGQVRVLTFAFVGDPVTGDRPDRKRTPFCLRIATGDLVQAAAAGVRGRSRKEAQVWYAAEAVSESVQTSLDYIVGLEELFGAVENGEWRDLVGDESVNGQGPALAGIQPPQRPAAQSPTSTPPQLWPPPPTPSLAPGFARRPPPAAAPVPALPPTHLRYAAPQSARTPSVSPVAYGVGGAGVPEFACL